MPVAFALMSPLVCHAKDTSQLVCSTAPSSFAGQRMHTLHVSSRSSPPRLTTNVKCSPVMAASGTQSLAGRNVLIIGGTRFSGLYLWHELIAQGAHVTLFNRGSKAKDDPTLMIPGETKEMFAARAECTSIVVGDRTSPDSIKAALGPVVANFDVVFDMCSREREDAAPLIDLLVPTKAHYVYMSSAGVYAKSETMPHVEGDEVDHSCRHKGKLNTEDYIRSTGLSFTSIRPTYIIGAGNYNPLEQFFFERIDSGLPVCIPGHGGHLTGLGHVRDLASAMAAAAAKPEVSVGQIYNIQDRQAVTFDGVANLCAAAMGKPAPKIIHYNPKDFDFGKKKAFPFRPVHFFTSPSKAMRELDWTPEYDLEKSFADAYNNDFLLKKATRKLKNDFACDKMVANAHAVPA
jgi:nucleoside-diphosphate-sugar epimerase